MLNKLYDITEGYNVVEISSADMLKQLESAGCYDTATGYFWMQVTGANISLWFDELIGIKAAASE